MTQKESTWIKCSERMPEEHKHYILFDGNYVLYGFRRENTFFCGTFKMESKYITHYMELPEPPEGEE
jgi:hypothetical protein